MRDQSHGRINGSALAAFATICERRLNMASVLKSAGEFRRRVVVKSPMRRRFKIRQEIGANNFLNEVVFFAPFRGVDAGQPPQDIRDSSRARPFTLTPQITKKTRQATSSTTFCFVHADRSTTSSSMRSRRLKPGPLVQPTVHRRIAGRNREGSRLSKSAPPWKPKYETSHNTLETYDRPPNSSIKFFISMFNWYTSPAPPKT